MSAENISLNFAWSLCSLLRFESVIQVDQVHLVQVNMHVSLAVATEMQAVSTLLVLCRQQCHLEDILETIDLIYAFRNLVDIVVCVYPLEINKLFFGVQFALAGFEG